MGFPWWGAENLLNVSPLGKGRGSSFEQIWIPFTQGCFVTSLVEISPVVWRRWFFNFFNAFFLFCYYLPLEKGEALHLNKIVHVSPSHLSLCLRWANNTHNLVPRSITTAVGLITSFQEAVCYLIYESLMHFCWVILSFEKRHNIENVHVRYRLTDL